MFLYYSTSSFEKEEEKLFKNKNKKENNFFDEIKYTVRKNLFYNKKY